jgi:hypothetical protein
MWAYKSVFLYFLNWTPNERCSGKTHIDMLSFLYADPLHFVADPEQRFHVVDSLPTPDTVIHLLFPTIDIGEVSVVCWTSPRKDVCGSRCLLGGGVCNPPPSPVWIWGGENLLYLSPPVKGTVQ